MARNRYRFQNFAERISNIKVDVAHRIEKVQEIPEDEKDSFFKEALFKWTELNCTEHYSAFFKEVKGFAGSYSQLVYQKDNVLEIVMKHLKVTNSLAFEPLLDLVSQLAKDLRYDFFAYFQDIFKILVSLLSRKEPELIENIFVTLAYIFKYLWKYMIRDLTELFSIYKSLLNGTQKLHIRKFAAESLAFLVRKVKDQESFCSVLFSSLNHDSTLVEGIGLILFESIKGVRKQFHSSASRSLSFMFKFLGPVVRHGAEMLEVEDSGIPYEKVFKTLQQTLRSCAKYTSVEYSSVLWDSLLMEQNRIFGIVEKCQKQDSLSDDVSEKLLHHLGYVLSLLELLVSWKSGAFIQSYTSLHNVILSSLGNEFVCSSVGKPLLKLISSLLQVNCATILQKHRSEILERVFTNRVSLEQISDFVSNIQEWNGFENNVLPFLLKYLEATVLAENDFKSSVVTKILALLSSLILQETKDFNSPYDLLEQQITLYFPRIKATDSKKKSKDMKQVLEYFLKFVTMDMDDIVENLTCVWYSVICLPHVRPQNDNRVGICLRNFLQSSISLMKEENYQSNFKHLFVLSQAVKAFCIVHQRNKQSSLEPLQYEDMCYLISNYPDNAHVLQAFECFCAYITCVDEESLSKEKLCDVYNLLKHNISSSSRVVRLLTLRILGHYSQFPMKEEDQLEERPCRLFRDCLQAEEIPPSFAKYRERLLYLRKLTYSSAYDPHLPELYKEVAVRYLVGNLYVNLSTIWEPVFEVIKSHTNEKNASTFWKLWREVMTTAAANAAPESAHEIHRDKKIFSDGSPSLFTKCMDTAAAVNQDENRADHYNFHLLIWQAMSGFPEIVEPKSRDVIPLFFQFLSNEYRRFDDTLASSQDIRKTSSSGDSASQDSGEDIQLENDEDKDITQSTKQHAKKNSVSKRKSKTLCACLKVFRLFKNPKALFKEPKLYETYLQLLSHKHSEVQKLAVDCLMTYRFAYLKPYKENLDKLLEDTTFKDELTWFSASENEDIKAEHRKELMSVLIRILLGKLQRRSGLGVSGKAGHTARRNIIMTFLANCAIEEIETFMHLIMDPFKSLLDETPSLAAVDLFQVIPLRKQTGFLNMLTQVISRLGHLISSYLPKLFTILIRLLNQCALCLERRDEISSFFVVQLKAIRQLGFSRVIEFFELFKELDYSAYTNELFHAAVWPQIDRLHQESLKHPSLLMKLLVCWSKNSKYHSLLIREKEDKTPLYHVFATLGAPGVSSDVSAVIMQLTINLLSLSDEEVIQSIEASKELDYKRSEDFQSPQGIQMIRPYIDIILQYIRTSIKTIGDKSYRKVKIRTKCILPELIVLSKISQSVDDPHQCQTVIKLLIPFLTTSSIEETQVNILLAIKNLIPNCTETRHFLKQVTGLFSSLTVRKSRQLLCDVFASIAAKEHDLKETSDVVTDMNSWDVKKLEEPDYERRIGAFKLFSESMEDRKFSALQIIPILHTSVHFVMESDDMSMRDLASSCIAHIINAVKGNEAELFQELIQNSFIPAVKSGIRSKKEVCRHEFISILALLVANFDGMGISDMKILANNDQEADFFLNIKHIQVHRRIKAVRLLSQCCQNGDLSIHSLYFYLLPLISHFIFDHLAAKDHNLVTETITALGTIAKQLPWQKYFHILSSYLKILQKEKERHKTIIRVVVSVLNAFHFDLSSLPDEEIDLNKGDWKLDGRVEEVDKGDEAHKSVNEDEDLETEADEHEGVLEETDMPKMDGVNDQSSESELKMARKIHSTVTTKILPQLQRCLTKKSFVADFHKMSHNKEQDEEELLRVPIALAMVKLLQQLPKATLNLHLQGVLLKVCNTLKSRARDVRDTARDTLIKITVSLGPGYFPLVLKEMRNVLRRGYQSNLARSMPEMRISYFPLRTEQPHYAPASGQKDTQASVDVVRICCKIDMPMLHVLSFTLHALLDNLSVSLKTGELDSSLYSILEIVIQDLFGDVAEEKEVEGITGKLHEAKAVKSFDTFELISKFASSAYVMQIIVPLKEVLESTQNHKTCRKVEEVLRRIGVGLQANSEMSQQDLLVFVHGTISETLEFLDEETKKKTLEQDTSSVTLMDTYIIPEAPGRAGKGPNLSKKTNKHILAEFGLQLLYTSLKRQKLLPSNEDHLSMLDPFVKVLVGCLQSQYNKIEASIGEAWFYLNRHFANRYCLLMTASCYLRFLIERVNVHNNSETQRQLMILILAMRSVSFLIKFPLPSLKGTILELSRSLFKLLKRYARIGAGKGENQELVMSSFKAMTVLIRDYKEFKVTNKQLQILLTFVEEDIFDYTRQATAFPLLKAILSRKLVVPAVNEVMAKVAELSITGESPSLQQQCRQLMLQFMLDYSLGKKLEKHLQFYINNLSYEVETGRSSALEMLASVFNAFPEKITFNLAGFFFVPLVMRLVNDDSPICRKLAAFTVKTLLQKLDLQRRDTLFEMTMTWTRQEKVTLRRLSIQVIGIFAEVEGSSFERRLSTVLPEITTTIDPNQYNEDEDEDMHSTETTDMDQLLFNSLTTLAKIIRATKVIKAYQHQEQMNTIWRSVQSHLLHSHAWIRLISSQLLGLLFGTWTPGELVKISGQDKPLCSFLLQNLSEKVQQLCKDMYEQLKANPLTTELAEQITKNLVYLAKVTNILGLSEDPKDTHTGNSHLEESDHEDVEGDEEQSISHTNVFSWLLNKMCYIASYEASQTPKQYLKRLCVFRWMAAVALDLGKDRISHVIVKMLTPIHREMNNTATSHDSELYKLAQEVLELIKGIVGKELFSASYAKLQQGVSEKKESRKRKLALQAAMNPEKNAKRKLKQNLAKREQRKRKLAERKPLLKLKKLRTESF